MTNRVALVTFNGTFQRQDVTFGSAADQCLLELAVSTISTFGPNGMRKKEFYLSFDYPLHHLPRALLPRPAWWTLLPPVARVLFGLALTVALGTARSGSTPCLVDTAQTILRLWSRHTLFGDLSITPATGKGYWPWHAWHRCPLVCVTVIIC